MSGLFGTRASILSDASLLIQIILLVILLIGFRLGKKKTASSLYMHGWLMKLLVALNTLTILFVMGPSFFLHFGSVVEELFVFGFPFTFIHHSIGLVAEILGIILVFKKFGKVRTWMRVTFMLWLVSLLLGLGFYVRYYV